MQTSNTDNNNTPHSVRAYLAPALVMAAIALYTSLDSIFLQAFPGQRAAYGLTILVAGAVAAYSLPSMRLLRRELVILCAWLLLNVVWLLMVLGQSTVYPTWVVGDMASLMLPLLLFLVACQYPGFYTSRRFVTVLCVTLLIAAVLGMILNVSPNTRFTSPTTLLFPLLWLEFSISRGTRKTIIGLALAVLGMLAIGSGERTAMILWLLSWLAVYGLVWPWRRIFVIGAIGLVLGVVFGATIFQAALRDALEQTRFRQNIEVGVDASLLTRLNEAQDVLTAFDKADGLRKVFGHGHGASFQPVVSLTERNVTDEGLVHHVHIGPAMMIYRYGLVGIAVIVLFWWAVIRNLLRQRSLPKDQWAIMDAAMGLAMLMYLIDFCLFNVIPKPDFSYVVGGFLFLESRHGFLKTNVNGRPDRPPVTG